MRIVFAENKTLFLKPGTNIQFEFINPLFDEVGSHTNSFTAPRNENNDFALGLGDPLNSNHPSEIECKIQLKQNSFQALLMILDVFDKEVNLFLSFHTGYLNQKSKAITLPDVDYGGKISLTGMTQDERYQHFRRPNGWSATEDGFAIFPVYMPQFYEGDEDQKTELLVFPDEDGIVQPLTIGDYWTKINKGIVNKKWEDADFPNWNKMYWYWTQFELGDLAYYRLGTIVPFPFLSFIIEKITKELGYNIKDSIILKDLHLQKMVILNNNAIHDSYFSMPSSYNLSEHVPNLTIKDFFDELKKYLGVLYMPSLYNNNIIVTSFKEIFNSTEIIDITKKADLKKRIRQEANQRLIIKTGIHHYLRPCEYINGLYRVKGFLSSSSIGYYDIGLISGGGYKWWQYSILDTLNLDWVELSKDFIKTQLNTQNAITIESSTHTLEQTIVPYYYDNDEYNNTAFKIDVKIPQGSHINGSHAFNNHKNKLESLILLYYNGPYYSGNMEKIGSNYGNSYPLGGNEEEWGDKSLHLDRNGVVQKWQNEYVEWVTNRKKLVTKFIDWQESDLQEFFFAKKFRINDTSFFIKKIKGNFIAEGETIFDETELYSI